MGKGRKRTGQDQICAQCGKTFYASGWQLADTRRRQGMYCSVACKNAAIKGRYFRPDGVFRYARKADGYIVFKVGVRKWVLEHRWVLEQALGRKLTPHEHIHHINGDKTDNRIENLRLLTNAEHYRLHHPKEV